MQRLHCFPLLMELFLYLFSDQINNSLFTLISIIISAHMFSNNIFLSDYIYNVLCLYEISSKSKLFKDKNTCKIFKSLDYHTAVFSISISISINDQCNDIRTTICFIHIPQFIIPSAWFLN